MHFGIPLTLTLLCVSWGCGGEPKDQFPIRAPADVVHGILPSEAAARRCQESVGRFLQNFVAGDGQLAIAALGSDFVARFCDPSGMRRIADENLIIQVFERAPGPDLDGVAFAERLATLTQDWSEIVRAEFELDEFFLDRGGELATGRGELYLAGHRGGGGRADLRAVCDVQFVSSEDQWTLSLLDLIQATSVLSELAPFVDVTEAVGLDQNISDLNQAMLQAFIDEHRTLALGGISAVDWNQDGYWDVIATLKDELSTLFINDGRGGFVPSGLPVSAPLECGVFLLHIDLDGDGVREMVSSKVGHYQEDWASCGLYSQRAGEWQFDPQAFRFQNRVGLRGIVPTTIVPLDANGDGLLDLFFGVYGNNLSRGDSYNLVEAHDGGDNYLFINQGGLTFTEESLERGLHGTQYTYVALALDFDGDGDEDLFEGNDFGPNILWVNDGEGHFTADEDSVFAGESAYTMGVTLADHDDDGRLSLYVVNMSSEAGNRICPIADGISEGMRERILGIASGNMLYTQSEAGEWVNVTESADCAEGEWGWGALFCDLDGDGDEEIFATNGFTSHSDPGLPDWDTYFWRQVAADGALMERGEQSYDVNQALNFEGSYAGRQRDRLFYAPDSDRQRFIDVAWHFGLDNEDDGRCALPLDVDGDGDLDLVMWTLQGLRLYENRSPRQHFARLRLEATRSHPHALGARVTLRAGGKTQHDIVQLVEGFQTQVPLDLHFAVPEAERIDSVQVTWPSGEVQEWRSLTTDRLILLVEGREAWSDSSVPAWPNGGMSLEELQALGNARSPGSDLERFVVLRMVANEGEAARFKDLEQDKRLADVEFRHELDPQRAGTTFVFNRGGNLKRAYRSAPSEEDLQALLELMRDEPPFPELSVLTGRRLVRQGNLEGALEYFEGALEGAPKLAGAAEGIARCQRMLGNFDESERAYERSIQIDPDYAIGHFNLGVLRARTGRPAEALAPFREALRINGEHLETLLAFGEAAAVAGDHEAALDAFERGAVAAPGNVKPHVLRGKTLGQLKRYESAKRAFEDALALDGENEEALRGIRLLERLLAGAR